jgi:hypothetical protein
MSWKIEYYSEKVQQDIMRLPEGLQARYIHLTSRMLINNVLKIYQSQ